MLAFRSAAEIIRFHEELDQALQDDPAIRDIHRLYDSLGAKISSLFAHQSIMIAVCIFLANTSGTIGRIKFVFLFGTLAYIILCFMMLPALNISTYDSPPDFIERKYYFARSIRRRVNYLTVSLHATSAVTLVIITTLAVDLYFFSSKLL
jgi:magnesium-transporting ATPase (P-type)